jgi:hypothetical protein
MTLTQEDLKSIGKVVRNEVTEVVQREVFYAFNAIWEDHLEPNMFTKDEARGMEVRLMKDNQNTRDFIAKKAAEFSGTSVQRDAVLNVKTNTVAQKLGTKAVFTESDVREVARIAPMAVTPVK